jgi:bacterioferritin-associated ferredoxin
MQCGGALGAGGGALGLRRPPAVQITSKGMVLTIIRIRVHNSAMIICVCKAISDRHIRSAVKNGATSLRHLTRDLGVGTCCGKCVPEAKAALSASLDGGDSPRLGLFPQPGAEIAA